MALSLLPSEEKVQILLDNVEDRASSIFFDEKKNITKLPIYTQADSNISGIVRLNFSDNKSVKHQGIFIQLIGETRNYHKQDKSEFFLVKNQELEPPGKHKGQLDYPFTFANFEKKHETYYGMAGSIRYYLKAVIIQEYGSHIATECEFAVQLPIIGLMFHQSFEIQLRIADYLMINVELNKTSMHMEECMIGKIMIEQIRLMIKKIQVAIIKREITSPTSEITSTKEDIVVKKELFNKCPKKGDIIPFKINMGALDLSPNFIQPNSKILLKYILILSFIDEDERSLFKPIDITIWRRR